MSARHGRAHHRLSDEAGVVGGLEGLAFGVLVFAIGLLVIVNAWGVVDAKSAAAAAAREAARAYVESPDEVTASARATTAARAAMAGHGRDVARSEVVVDAPDGLARCARVLVEVRHRLPLVRIPLLGGAGSGFTVAARHAELVDPYRSGLDGVAACG